MTTNIAYFPQTPFENEMDNEERSRRTSTQYLETSTTTRTRARNEETPEGNPEETTLINVWKADIAQYYLDTFGVKMPPVAKADVNDALEAGLEPVLVFRALDEAAIAPRPSWAYSRAILRRLVNEGCLTEAAYNARQRKWQSRRRRSDDDMPF